MSENSVGDSGITAIARALSHNKTLTSLNVSWNPMGDAGATDMAVMLKNNTTLEQLEMYDFSSHKSYSTTGEDGFKALIDSLQHNQQLQKLTLPDRLTEYLRSLPTYHHNAHRIQLKW